MLLEEEVHEVLAVPWGRQGTQDRMVRMESLESRGFLGDLGPLASLVTRGPLETRVLRDLRVCLDLLA